MLKKLELVGFKSFATKTVLEFPGGISAIVGPNGSGKSNVIDALRWLLGERDAKNLRGAKAEDLIFAGTPSKPRMGLAQASIYFDNTNAFFPVDFSEVVVSRQVSRDGDSRYFLNKAEVRLRDIIDFFARVRLGARGMVVVGQGESDMFIKAAPRERREMIEEILGLREYQLKKAEAERKHKNSLINLDKVSALIEEIAPHLRMLRRQTARWDKRAVIDAERQGLERTFFAVKLAEVHSHFSKLDPEIKRFDTTLAAVQKELGTLERAAHALEASEPSTHEAMRKVRTTQVALSERRLNLQKELGRLEARLEFFVAKSKDVAIPADRAVECLRKIKEELEKFHILDLVSIRSNVRTLVSEISELFRGDKGAEDEARELEGSKKKIMDELHHIETELRQQTQAEQAMNTALETQNSEFKKAFSAIQSKKNENYALEGEKNKLLFERERWSLKEGDIKGQVAQAGYAWKEFLASIAHEPVNLESDLHALPDLEKKLLRMRGELASMGDVDEAIVKEAKETEERHDFLATQSEDLKKAIIDLEKLRRDLEKKINAEFSSAIHKINQEFLRLFELMFGGGKAKLVLVKPERKSKSEEREGGEDIKEVVAEVEEKEDEKKQEIGIDIEVSIPRKRITGLDMLSGGERSLVSIAALFALVSVSPPPFLVLDEIDAALDERNARRFAEMLKGFSEKTQFVVVTHNRATMEVANVLYGVTMGEDGTSRVLSLKIEDAPAHTPA